MKKYFLLFILFAYINNLFAINTYKENSVLADGNWLKIATSQQGIHKISYSQLSNWGIGSPENVALYSNGGFILPEKNNIGFYDDLEKIPVLHAKDNNGNNCIFFYSTGTVKWDYDSIKQIFIHTQNLYSDSVYFFITSDKLKSDKPQSKPITNINSDYVAYNYNAYQLYEKEEINIHKSGRIWYSETINQSMPKTITFNLPNVIETEKAILNVSATAISSKLNNLFEIFSNNTPVDSIFFSFLNKDYVYPLSKLVNITPSDKINIKLLFKPSGANSESWLDFISINYKSKLKFTDKQLIFRNTDALKRSSISYHIESNATEPVLWDISNPIHPKKMEFTQNNGIINFSDEGFSEYLLFDAKAAGIPEPTFKGKVKNQNIHGESNYDMIIVSHPNFIASSEKLAEFHRQNDQLKVLVLNSFQVYNEFSCGIPDASGIRNMVRMFYIRSRGSVDSLKYLLLMGDGSFNNRDNSGKYPNYIPTYESAFFGGETYCSDDYYGLLDTNSDPKLDEGGMTGQIDIGIGRIPCQTVKEAEIVVAKTINYVSPEALGEWRNVLAFMADDWDDGGDIFMDQSDSLIKIVEENYPGFYSDRIYFDAYNQVSSSDGLAFPDAKKAIAKRVDDGALILNYIGHANEFSIASENVLEINDILSWSNKKKLPVFVTATCEFGRFDYDKMSAGEHILFHEAGGGVALFTTTRKVYAENNFRLSIEFYKSVFKYDENGDNIRMGDIMRIAKNGISKTDNNRRSFALLGDPALRISFPKYKIETNTINGININDTVTIGALEEVTIEGEITDNYNNRLTNFKGDVKAIVYDKESKALTLGNDYGAKYEYPVRNNIIYKATSTVENGTFSFSFIVPKDISYSIGTGKIFYYALGDSIDGNGCTEKFKIGGSSKNPTIDLDPPKMDIYLNNENFKLNDKVSSSSLLFVSLFDESGINTVGTGIGHDIVAILDDDYSNPIVLNDYYISDKNTYKSGKAGYPLSNIKAGEHKISVTAWDVHNNSIKGEITFIVEEGFEITSVNNFPNPVNTFTTFNIFHNLPGDVFEISIDIFNLGGNKVDQIIEKSGSYGTTQIQVDWNLLESNYPILNQDILIYRVTMENDEGLTATGTGKLLINK